MRIEKSLRLAGVPLLAAALAACTASGGGGTGGMTPTSVALTGSIGVAEQQSKPLGMSPLAAPSALGVAGINSAIQSVAGNDGLQPQSFDAPIRGLNAGVLSSFLGSQSGEKPLFGLGSQSMLAVDSSGNVIAEGEIQDDGQWAVVIETEQWSDAGNLALVQGYEYDDGFEAYWVCLEPLEYQTDSGEVLALFGAEIATSGLGPLSSKSTGLFQYSEKTANPTSLASASDVAPVSDSDFAVDADDDGIADYLACGNADKLAYAPVTADFNWSVPPVMEEAFLYDYGVAFGLDVSEPLTPAFVSVAVLDDIDGTMEMEVVKPKGITQTMALVMTDVAFYDESKFGMPLTPTFALDAAIDTSKPYIEVADEGHDYEVLAGGMAYIEGTVYGSLGQPAPGSLVIGVLDSEEILAFNLAIANQEGVYQMLLPATGEELGYYIVAVSADGSEAGLPEGVPPFASGDPDEVRYGIHGVISYDNAHVEMISLAY